jgi:predicted oxidoreductase
MHIKGISPENVIKMNILAGLTGLNNDELIRFVLDRARWIVNMQSTGYEIVAITVERREPMPKEFPEPVL